MYICLLAIKAQTMFAGQSTVGERKKISGRGSIHSKQSYKAGRYYDPDNAGGLRSVAKDICITLPHMLT